MARRNVQGSMWVDDDLQDGYVLVEGDGRARLYMTMTTYRALAAQSGALRRLVAALKPLRGTYLIPRSVIEPEAAGDLRLGLSLVDPEPSEYCVYPPCGLRSTQVHKDGFALCDTHAELLSDWDDLVA